MSVVVEFTVYPPVEGETPPAYVRAAVDEFERAGCTWTSGRSDKPSPVIPTPS